MNKQGQNLQLPIYLDGLPHDDLHLPDPLTGFHPIFFLTISAARSVIFELIAPRTPPAIAIAVVIAKQIITTSLLAAADFERLIDRG